MSLPMDKEKEKRQSKAKVVTQESKTSTEDQSLLLPLDEIANPFMANDVSPFAQTQESSTAKAAETIEAAEAGEAAEAAEDTKVAVAVAVAAEASVAVAEEAEEGPTLQEEIALWKYSAPDELYMLLKEDPSRYLTALEKDRELAQKHGCLVTRENGKLRIKFRIYPEDRWTECGFFEDFDDQVIYQEFSESVQRSLNMPRNRRDPKKMSRKDYLKKVEDSATSSDRAHISAELDQPSPKPKISNVGESKDREEALPIDREKMLALKAKQMKEDNLIHERAVPFLSKKTRNVEQSSPAEPAGPAEQVEQVEPGETRSNVVLKSETKSETRSFCPRESQSRSQEGADLGLLLDAYVQQLLERMNGCVRTWLNSSSKRNGQSIYANKGLEQLISNLLAIEQKVPQNLLQDYKNLITSLSAAPTNDFYNFMVDQKQHFLPRHLEPIYDSFLIKIVSNSSLFLGPEFGHGRICQLLGLSEVDVQLLEEHNVDLRELWNNSQVHSK